MIPSGDIVALDSIKDEYERGKAEARLEGYLRARAEVTEQDHLRRRLEELESQVSE